jgi:hypothetical protein
MKIVITLKTILIIIIAHFTIYGTPLDHIQDSVRIKESNNNIKKGYGLVTVNATPKKCSIYINGKKVGTGSAIKLNYPVGTYQLYVFNKKESFEKQITIRENEVTIEIVNLEKMYIWQVVPSFSAIFNRGFLSYGPSFDIGFKIYKQYFGINFLWNNFTLPNWPNVDKNELDKEDYSGIFGGSMINWSYDIFVLNNIIYISPGIFSGFWSFSGYKYSGQEYNTYNEEWENSYDFFKDYFYAGLSVKAAVVLKFVYFDVYYGALIGSSLGHHVKASIGLQFPKL